MFMIHDFHLLACLFHVFYHFEDFVCLIVTLNMVEKSC
uniref:Uncharacterized protein n=1 Tax=Rhizophora mucronata TaxID=61149 RepID=A0A2P2PWN0_RHIMU